MFKINVLRMLMTGRAKEYCDLWEADRDRTEAAKSYEELLNKVKDNARRRKLDSTVKEKVQQGRDPMDVGTVGGYSWEEPCYDQDGVYAIGFRARRQRQRRMLQLRCHGAFLKRMPAAQRGQR